MPNAGAPVAALLTEVVAEVDALAAAAPTLAGATTAAGALAAAVGTVAADCHVSPHPQHRPRTASAVNSAALVKVVHCDDAGTVGVYGSDVIAAGQWRT